MAELYYTANHKKVSSLYDKLPIWSRMSAEECAAYPYEESTVTLQGEKWIVKSMPIRQCPDFCSVGQADRDAIEGAASAIPYLLDFLDLKPDNFVLYDPETVDLYGIGAHKFLSHVEKPGDYALQNAADETPLSYEAFPDVEAMGLTWPLPTLRLTSANREQLTDLVAKIAKNWEAYAEGNSITVLALRQGEKYQIKLILCGEPANTQIRPTSSTLFPNPFGPMGKIGFAILDRQQWLDCQALTKKILADESVADDPQLSKYAPWQKHITTNYSVGSDNIHFIMDMEIRNAFVEKLLQMAVFEFSERAYPKYKEFIEHAAD